MGKTRDIIDGLRELNTSFFILYHLMSFRQQTQINSKLGSTSKAADSEKLDNLDSTQFLRSDSADTKTAGNLLFNDNVHLQLGTSADMNVTHSGSHSYIDHNGTGHLYLDSVNNILMRVGADETAIECIENGEVELRYNNSAKLRTTTSGVAITGTLTTTTGVENATSSKSGGIKIRLNGSNMYITNNGSNA